MIFDDKLIAIMVLCNFYNIKARFIYIVSGATKHLYNCPLVHRLVGWLVGWSVTHLFDNSQVAPYWPSWPC